MYAALSSTSEEEVTNGHHDFQPLGITIKRNVTPHLLDTACHLAFRGGGKGVTSFSEELRQLLSDVVTFPTRRL